MRQVDVNRASNLTTKGSLFDHMWREHEEEVSEWINDWRDGVEADIGFHGTYSQKR